MVIVSKHDKTIPYEKAAFCDHIECSKVIHLEGSECELDHHTQAFTYKEARFISFTVRQK